MLKRIFRGDSTGAVERESVEYTEMYGCIEKNNWDRTLELLEGVNNNGKIGATTWYVKRHTNGTVWWKLLPIHNACRRNAPPLVIEALLRAYPESIAIVDTHGMLPLHWSLWGCASMELISLLLNADQSGVFIADKYGRLPLHLACEYSVSCKDIVEVLSSIYPEAKFLKDDRGKIPLALVNFSIKNNREIFKQMKKEVKAVRDRRRGEKVVTNDQNPAKDKSKSPHARKESVAFTNKESRRSISANPKFTSVPDKKSLTAPIQPSRQSQDHRQIHPNEIQSSKLKEDFISGETTRLSNSPSYFDGKPRLALTMTSCSASTTTHQNDYDPEPLRSSRQRRAALTREEAYPKISLDAYLDDRLVTNSRSAMPINYGNDGHKKKLVDDEERSWSTVSSLTKEEFFSDD